MKNKTIKQLEDQNRNLERELDSLKKGIKNLRNSNEHKLYEKFDNMLEGCQIIDKNFRYVYVNKTVARQGRKKKEELIGKTMMEVYPEIENTPMFSQLKKCMEERSFLQMENEFTYTDNSRGWFELTMQPIPEGVFILSIDITQRKQFEKSLRENERRLIAAEKLAKLGNFSWIIDSGEIQWSAAMFSLLGYSSNELVNLNFVNEKIHHADDRQKILDWLNMSINSGQTELQPLEYRIIHKDGHVLYIRTQGRIEYKDGKAYKVFAVVQDITEKKKAEQALKISEEKYRSLSQNIPGMVYRALSDWSIDTVSNTEMVTGYTREEFLNGALNWQDLIHPEWKEPVFREGLEITEKPGTIVQEYQITHKNGKAVWVSDHKTSIFDDDGKFMHIDGVVFDISWRKEYEQELIKAKEKAEESDNLKSAFLANMSHEVRTPMNGILGFTELLKDPDFSMNEREEFISGIERSGNRMLNTLNDIIDISKLEAGVDSVHKTKTNVNHILDEQYELLKPKIHQASLNWKCNKTLAEEKAVIYTDRDKLSRIIYNLIANAIKYTKKGSIEFGYNRKNTEIEFYCKDTGIGIPENRQEAIFDPFVQADLNYSKAYEGACLSLSITKAYIELLGGEIWLESMEDKGTNFYFTIPAEGLPEDNGPKKTDQKNKAVNTDLKDIKLLIVEDEKYVDMYLSILLENQCNKLLHAATGKEAVEVCRNIVDIDCILMDLKMPELNGYEATRQIRTFNKKVIIIAQTAYALQGDRKKALKAGCNDYITKPIVKENLFETLSKYFRIHE
ncbi:MAG: PAS domain S-box protein [Bacteroidales bacterium]|nr:PAS domain S-box protein [Bacteroidales bacterium]MCF8388137.1 PAS domain S-box protein [Bacteroidales bacterium]MCF8397953.1 PAS domain S-box protein [Bacteroidales bacterium]